MWTENEKKAYELLKDVMLKSLSDFQLEILAHLCTKTRKLSYYKLPEINDEQARRLKKKHA